MLREFGTLIPDAGPPLELFRRAHVARAHALHLCVRSVSCMSFLRAFSLFFFRSPSFSIFRALPDPPAMRVRFGFCVRSLFREFFSFRLQLFFFCYTTTGQKTKMTTKKKNKKRTIVYRRFPVIEGLRAKRTLRQILDDSILSMIPCCVNVTGPVVLLSTVPVVLSDRITMKLIVKCLKTIYIYPANI